MPIFYKGLGGESSRTTGGYTRTACVTCASNILCWQQRKLEDFCEPRRVAGGFLRVMLQPAQASLCSSLHDRQQNVCPQHLEKTMSFPHSMCMCVRARNKARKHRVRTALVLSHCGHKSGDRQTHREELRQVHTQGVVGFYLWSLTSISSVQGAGNH